MEANSAEFIALIHRMVGIRARISLFMPMDLKQLQQEITRAVHDGKPGAPNFANFFSLSVALLRQESGLTMTEIAQLLQVPQSSATRIVDDMVARGDLERKQDSNDRRVIRILLSDEGLLLFRASNHFLQRRVNRVLDAFKANERTQLLDYMHRVADALELEAAELELGDAIEKVTIRKGEKT